MKILYICHRIPYPPNKGDKIRSFNEIKHLAVSHNLYLAFLIDNPEDLNNIQPLRNYCQGLDFDVIDRRRQTFKAAPQIILGSPFSLPFFYSRKLQQAIDRRLQEQRFDAIFCFSGPMAEYVLRSQALSLHPRPRLVIDFCDVDSDKWGQFSSTSTFPMRFIYRLEQKRLLAFEAKVNEVFDHSVFVTENEARLFKRLVPSSRKIEVIGNGVDTEYFDPAQISGQDSARSSDAEPILLFTGAMDYHANVDAVSWFCSDILPKLRKRGVGGEFCIVGGKPVPAVQAMTRISGVRVPGFVNDIRPWYGRAAISVAPMRLARGVQNKVLEAMAMGKPVVATRKTADGIGATDDRHLLVADNAEAFAAAVDRLWKDSAARRQLGLEARKFVVENFAWQEKMARLEKLLMENVSKETGTEDPPAFGELEAVGADFESK